MSGFDALRGLRKDEATRGIPIVMISGNAQATEQFYVQRIGADNFMSCRLVPEHLLSFARPILRGHRCRPARRHR